MNLIQQLVPIRSIEVDMAEVISSRAPTKLTTSGIGSCIVITFYDLKLKVGTLAHVVLPDSKMSEHVGAIDHFKFADLAIDEMINRMKSFGSRISDLEAKIVGGANMFPSLKEIDVGRENINVVQRILVESGINVTGEAVGGNVGRSVELDIETGTVIVTIRKLNETFRI